VVGDLKLVIGKQIQARIDVEFVLGIWCDFTMEHLGRVLELSTCVDMELE
jgi:hypothetical protein